MTTAIDITLNEETHVYTDSTGRVITSVTQALNEMRTGYRFHAEPWRLQRGSAIHAAIELAAKGKLDIEKWTADLHAALTPKQAQEVLGRTKAGIKFLTENCSSEGSMQEVIVHNPVLNIAGKLDWLGPLKDGRLCLADWKGAVDPWAKLQVSIYSLCLKIKPDVAVAVELGDDGNYVALWGSRTPKRDTAKFDLGLEERYAQAMLTSRNWLIANKQLARRMEHVEEMYNAVQ